MGFCLSLKQHDCDLFVFVIYLWQYKDIFFMFLFNKISLWITIYFHEVGTSDTETRRTFCDAKGAFFSGRGREGNKHMVTVVSRREGYVEHRLLVQHALYWGFLERASLR